MRATETKGEQVKPKSPGLGQRACQITTLCFCSTFFHNCQQKIENDSEITELIPGNGVRNGFSDEQLLLFLDQIDVSGLEKHVREGGLSWSPGTYRHSSLFASRWEPFFAIIFESSFHSQIYNLTWKWFPK